MNKCIDYSVLKTAREKFGNRRQIAVAAEELCELAKAILKYVRYDDNERAVESTKEDVLTEYADVIIILDHIKNIYGITEEEALLTVTKKIDRLKRWVNSEDGMEITTTDRAIDCSKVSD